MINLFYIISSSGNQAVNATGGTISEYTLNGITYRSHTFLSSGTLQLTSGIGDLNQVSYLIVAGGGAGEYVLGGGGGGAGGMLTGVINNPSSQNYSIVVGSYGIVGTLTVRSTNGENSSAFGLTAIGGGAGGVFEGTQAGILSDGRSGGSGGGGGKPSASSSLGGQGTSGQGNSGAGGFTVNGRVGGGGGAGGSGTNSPIFVTAYSGNTYPGGPGLTNNLRTGQNVTYAAGGTGFPNSRGNSFPIENGAANTGNGGSTRGNGGSGIVVVQYRLN